MCKMAQKACKLHANFGRAMFGKFAWICMDVRWGYNIMIRYECKVMAR